MRLFLPTFKKCGNRGFTMVEILMALALTGMSMGAIYSVFISSNKSYKTQENVADAQQRIRVGLEMMIRDLRLAGLDPEGSATDGIDSNGAGFKEATSTKIRFTADLDMNGAIDDQGTSTTNNEERLTYILESGSLRRYLYEGHTTDESQQTLIEDVSALTFNYEDESGSPITKPVSAADLPNIRTVVISMSCQGIDGLGNTFTRTLNARVNCRNLWL